MRRARAGSGTARALQATDARACGVGTGCARGARQAGPRRWARVGHAAGARPGRWARGRALGTRQAGAGRAGRARPGLALGSALGALSPFSIRFDSFFFPESPNEHRSL